MKNYNNYKNLLIEKNIKKFLKKLIFERTVTKDKWGRPSVENGKPSLFFGFDAKQKKWVQGPCTGIYNNNEACRKKLGLKTRAQMTAKEEALNYKPKINKLTPWPIQVNYYRPADKKFPTGHIECRSLLEPQYQMNANPIRNNWIEALTSNSKDNNFWNMPMTGPESKHLPDKPTNAYTIYVYLTDKEYYVFKKATPKINIKLGYKADKLAQQTKSPDQAIKNYNVLTQNCADGVAKALGVSVKGLTKTEAVIVTAAGFLFGPVVGGALAALDTALDITLPADVFQKIKEVYKGRISYAVNK